MVFLSLGQSGDWTNLFTGSTYTESGHYGINDPSEADVRRVVEAIACGEQDLAILMRADDEDTYIQTADGGRGKLLLEYQDGSLDAHYVVVSPNPTPDQIINAFLAFIRSDTAWRSQFTWRKYQ
ncbi:MAG: hypothetical protein IT324_09365 [Anaerolineae bacterium]|nr:hypothetical protein [Anaerolineae bacterium]